MNNCPTQGTRWTLWLQKHLVHKQYKESQIGGISRVWRTSRITHLICSKNRKKKSSEVSLCWLSAQWQNEYTTGITVLGTFSRRTWDTFYITGKPSWAANLTESSNHLFSAKTRTTCYFHVVWKRLKCKVSHGCVILHCFTSVYNFQLKIKDRKMDTYYI